MKFSEARTSAEKWFTRRPRTLRAPYSHPSSIFCCGMRNRKTALSIGNCSKNGTRQLPTGIWKLPRILLPMATTRHRAFSPSRWSPRVPQPGRKSLNLKETGLGQRRTAIGRQLSMAFGELAGRAGCLGRRTHYASRATRPTSRWRSGITSGRTPSPGRLQSRRSSSCRLIPRSPSAAF